VGEVMYDDVFARGRCALLWYSHDSYGLLLTGLKLVYCGCRYSRCWIGYGHEGDDCTGTRGATVEKDV
jgi:hypothetical protein